MTTTLFLPTNSAAILAILSGSQKCDIQENHFMENTTRLRIIASLDFVSAVQYMIMIHVYALHSDKPIRIEDKLTLLAQI